MVRMVIGYGGLVLGSLFALVSLYMLVRKLLPTKVSEIADKVVAFVDQAEFLAALTPIYLIAKRRGDEIALRLLADLRKQAATWDDVEEEPVASPIVDIATLTAQVAALQAAIQAKGVAA